MTDRQLDALVAQHVMGWTHVTDGALAGNFSSKGHDAYAKPPIGYVAKIPRYSTTGNGMLAVMEYMAKRGHLVSLLDRGENARICVSMTDFSKTEPIARWHSRFDGPVHYGSLGSSRTTASDSAESAPRAVAVAALRALGVEVEP